MFRLFRRLRKDVSGATAIEYSLIAGLISLVVVTTATFAGHVITDVFNLIGNTLEPLH